MYIALSNAISRKLPKEQSGLGMGLLSMLNFIAGAVFASVYSTMVDKGASADWVLINAHPDAFVFSNMYLVLAILLLCLLLLYHVQFGRAKRNNPI